MRLDESDKENVQRTYSGLISAVSDSSARYDADSDDEAGVHLELGRRYVRLGMRKNIFKKKTTD